ncbi:MAG TPA: hypothetical protein VGV38_09155 [Pyrinomonadaceae bacterium]|nr:hypothetical protein [Pyrinomonadaceae bacterium]
MLPLVHTRRRAARTLPHAPAAGVALLLLSVVASAQSVTADAELPRFQPVSERLYRGAQPRAGGLRRLVELGVNTVVNLRGTSARTRAEEAEARALGLGYFNVPLPVWGRPGERAVRRVLEIINARESGRVFVHCKDGVDRTGTVVALYRVSREGWDAERAIAEARRNGMRGYQYWMRDYVSDYARRQREAEVAAHQAEDGEDFADRLGDGMRVGEREVFRARRIGRRVLRATPVVGKIF